MLSERTKGRAMCYDKRMTGTADIFNPEDLDAKERAIAEAEAQIAAGQGVPYEQVRRWLQSWGTEDELPPPPWK